MTDRNQHAAIALATRRRLAILATIIVVSTVMLFIAGAVGREAAGDTPTSGNDGLPASSAALSSMDESPPSSVVPVGEIDSNDLHTLRERMANLTPREKKQLRSKRERFERFSPAERRRISELHADLTSRSDRLQLHRVLVQYTDWLAGLSARQQLDLKEMPIDARIEAIRKRQHSQEQKALEEFAITPEDAERIETWLGEFAQSNRKRMESQLPKELKKRLNSIKDPNQKRRILIASLYFSRSHGGGQPVTVPTADQLQGLLVQLTPSVRQRLEQLEDPESQFKTVLRWVQGYLRDRFRHVKKEDLEAFFHQLPPEMRERLESMSPRKMQAELTWLYHRARFRNSPGAAGYGRRRGGGPPRRGDGMRSPSGSNVRALDSGKSPGPKGNRGISNKE